MVFESSARINSLIDELQHKLLVLENNTDSDFGNDIHKLQEIRDHVLKIDSKFERNSK